MAPGPSAEAVRDDVKRNVRVDSGNLQEKVDIRLHTIIYNLTDEMKRAMDVFTSLRVDLVLGGHIHLPYVSDTCARAKPAAPRPMYCVQAGTALSHRVRHGSPNSVNIIRWTPPADGAAR